jgi:hypothetical protein
MNWLGVARGVGAVAKKALSLGTKALGNPTLQTAGMLGFQNYMDRRAQERAFAQNKAWWHERFDKEAMYNSPVQQKARMMEAGLNPALMYSGGQTGGTVSGGSAQGKIAEKYQMAELALMSAQVENIQQDSAKKRAEADLLGEKTEGQKTGNAIAVQKLFQEGILSSNLEKKVKNELAQQANNIEKSLQEIENLKERLNTQKAMTDVQNATVEEKKANKALTDRLIEEKNNALWQWETLKKDLIENGINPDDGLWGQAAQGVNVIIEGAGAAWDATVDWWNRPWW